jgi:hypothetical protein
LVERISTGSENPDSTGVIRAPSNWNATSNNKKFDREKIVGWLFAIVSTSTARDSIIVSFDNFTRTGARSFPVIFFNGKDYNAPVTISSAWGNGGISVAAGAGPVTNTNAMKFVEGDAWSGLILDMTSTNMKGSWPKDTLQMKIKAEAGGDATFRAQFESASGKRGIKFTVIRDNVWHTYKFALRDMTFNDGAPNFDTSAVIKFGLMSDGHAITGKVDYFSDIWTGNPVFDVFAPAAPTGVAAAGGGFTNLITWNDVPQEAGARYNVYVSDKAWTDPADPTVEDVPPYNYPTGAGIAYHYLRAPNTDQNVTLYYGIVAKDAAGNESLPGLGSAVTTMAKGVPTISLTVPSNFTADGDLAEWASIKPFGLNTQKGTAHAVPNFPITDSMDLSAKAYVAVDAQYLYVAFDVIDDVVLVDTSAAVNDYEQDCPDLFIGLYDWRGKYHSGYTGGAKPEYHIRFSKNRLRIDNGGAILTYANAGNPNYSWTEKVLESGYIVEARIPLANLASALTSRSDQLFVPIEGNRIPIDFAINDQDVAGIRNGILCYSILNDDKSWSDMFYWTYTWIGNMWTGVKQISEIAHSYELSQNYPNPFNPSTQIKYSLQKPGMVFLKVYDMIGREVTSLVHEYQKAGSYTVTLNSMDLNLSSGIYFYRLQSGSFVAINKMVLLK